MYLSVIDLGIVPFKEAFLRQAYIRNQIIEGKADNTLILCEHPHTITATRQANIKDNILDYKFILDNNIDFITGLDRGGDVTYHGPGQLMGYLIFDLRNFGRDLGVFLYNIEKTIINTLATFNIEAHSLKGFRGVWVGDKKIASIGIGIRKWVSLHGFGLNVDTDLSFFDIIRPCGINVSMTSIKERLGSAVCMDLVKERIVDELQSCFGFKLRNNLKTVGKVKIRRSNEAQTYEVITNVSL